MGFSDNRHFILNSMGTNAHWLILTDRPLRHAFSLKKHRHCSQSYSCKENFPSLVHGSLFLPCWCKSHRSGCEVMCAIHGGWVCCLRGRLSTPSPAFLDCFVLLQRGKMKNKMKLLLLLHCSPVWYSP